MGTCCCCFHLLQDVLQDLPSLQQWDPCSSHKQATNDIIKSYMNKKSTPEHISGHLKIQRGTCAGRGASWLDSSRELMKGLMPGGCGRAESVCWRRRWSQVSLFSPDKTPALCLWRRFPLEHNCSKPACCSSVGSAFGGRFSGKRLVESPHCCVLLQRDFKHIMNLCS